MLHHRALSRCYRTALQWGRPPPRATVESSALEREAMGIPESLVRYSTGIEHADDLISDLDYALSATSALSTRPRTQ